MSVIKKIRFDKLEISVMKEAKTGNILNHNCEVVMDVSIGSKFPCFFNLI